MFKASVRVTVAAVSGLVLTVGAGVSAAAVVAPVSSSTSDVVHACVAKRDRHVTNYYGRKIIVIPHGTTRIVAAAKRCKSWETPTSWNHDGEPGKSGVNGAAGTNGKDGGSGAGGQDGKQGVPGQGVRMGALPIGDPRCSTGGVSLTSAAQTVVVCDGGAGIAGAAGLAGANGIDGANGASGVRGDDGATGATGTNGLNGTGVTLMPLDSGDAQCSTGGVAVTDASSTSYVCNGMPGATGQTGAPGAAGTDGQTGGQGAPGANGTNGIAGTTGASGANGAAGTPGTAGAVGSDGAAGAPGLTGPAGANGADGSPGPAGPAGPTGPAGLGSMVSSGVFTLQASNEFPDTDAYLPLSGYLGTQVVAPLLNYDLEVTEAAHTSVEQVIARDQTITDMSANFGSTTDLGNHPLRVQLTLLVSSGGTQLLTPAGECFFDVEGNGPTSKACSWSEEQAVHLTAGDVAVVYVHAYVTGWTPNSQIAVYGSVALTT